MASRDTHGRRLADAQQQVASREVGDLWTLGSRQLPGTLTAAGSSRGLAISSRGPHGSQLLQGPSDQKAGALTAAGFSRGQATSRQGPLQRPSSPEAQRSAAGALTAAS
ncbi:unnamed protein product, partial [Staurois parvus]